jgi:hypothetical protein
MKLEDVIAHGNRGHNRAPHSSLITCKDGFRLSVIAGGGTYCTPRPSFCWGDTHPQHIPEPPDHIVSDEVCDYPGPYSAVEVGFPTTRPEPWDEWSKHCEDPEKPTDTVYGYVPVDLVRSLVAAHGGEGTP